MKVCVIKTSSMGDVIHTLPALTDAQRAIPNLSIDWVVEENFAEIPHWHSAVKQIIPIALRRWRKSPFSVQTKNEWKSYRTLLQVNQYDAVIDAQGLFKSAFFATRLANGIKHGYDRKSIREPIASLFYDKKYAISYQQHAVERIRQLFAQALSYPLQKEKGDYDIARHFISTDSIEPYVIFFHSTTRDEKHWPEREWRNLIEKVTALYPEKLIIVTLGKDGALYHLEGKKDVISGKPLQPVDTTGAGDAFVGGLLAGLSQHPNWKENDVLVQIIRQANACGALATTAKGAMSALPNKAQLAAFLAN